jgi:hypothetical protein
VGQGKTLPRPGSKGPRWNERQGRQQLAVARDANEIARSAAYAASDAAAAARSQAHIAKVPLIIATIALFVSITTPEKNCGLCFLETLGFLVSE